MRNFGPNAELSQRASAHLGLGHSCGIPLVPMRSFRGMPVRIWGWAIPAESPFFASVRRERSALDQKFRVEAFAGVRSERSALGQFCCINPTYCTGPGAGGN